ncbi:MAG: sugar ABC transporter ATP-binding protein [Anaerolineaceae bacterium]
MNPMQLEMKNISLEFPGVHALDSVNFSASSGSVHALVGANGAGKSSLMKVLAGAYGHYSGEIFLGGESIEIRSPKDAKKLGIEIVYQEVDTALIPHISVAENVMFDLMVNEIGKKQLVNWPKIKKTANDTLQKMNVDLDVNLPVSEISLAQKQMILIARCILANSKFIVFDEPTAPLSNKETEELFRIIRDLKAKGIGVIFISHRLNELYEICDHLTIMRDGRVVKEMPLTKDVSQLEIVEYMLGHSFEEQYIKKESHIGKPLLEVKHLTEVHNEVQDISLTVRKGEIVGIAGLVGAGKSELCKTLFGAMKASSGEIKLAGNCVKFKSPCQSVSKGLALVPEERRKEGILINSPVYVNISIANLKKYSRMLSVINRKKEKKDAKLRIDDLMIKTPSENQEVAYLSGGNQQKVVIAKWLNSDAILYIFDEPTKGIDVGAKRELYELIENLAQKGCGILYVTCEFTEIINICDRAYVMYDGRIVQELEKDELNEKALLYYSTGGR